MYITLNRKQSSGDPSFTHIHTYLHAVRINGISLRQVLEELLWPFTRVFPVLRDNLDFVTENLHLQKAKVIKEIETKAKFLLTFSSNII